MLLDRAVQRLPEFLSLSLFDKDFCDLAHHAVACGLENGEQTVRPVVGKSGRKLCEHAPLFVRGDLGDNFAELVLVLPQEVRKSNGALLQFRHFRAKFIA